MENRSSIMVIVLENRIETATRVQDLLTKYGCHIRVRLGLHDAGVEACSNSGMILLQLCDKDLSLEAFAGELRAVAGVKVKYMTLDF